MVPKKTTRMAIVGAIYLAIGGRWWIGARDPVVHIPTRTVPTPNAYDVYVHATEQLVLEKKIDRILSYPNKQNTMTEAQKRALVRDNAVALATLRSGLRLPYELPPVRSFTTEFPYLAGYRSLARLMVVEGNARRAAGDMPGAVASYLDTMEFGGQITNGGPLIHRLVSLSCESIGRKPLWENLDSLNAVTAKEAVCRMDTISTRHIPFAQALQEEKYACQSSILEMFRKPARREETTPQGKDTDSEALPQSSGIFVPRPFYLIWSKQSIIDNNTRYMDSFIAQAERPYALRNNPAPVPEPGDLLNKIFLPIPEPARLKEVNSETQNALLMVALAVRAYRIEHKGTVPASLKELVPTYLSVVPADLFSTDGKTPLRYHRAEHGYTLYSIGPDGQDNNGVAIDNPDHRTEYTRRAPNADSKGDIVARLNRW